MAVNRNKNVTRVNVTIPNDLLALVDEQCDLIGCPRSTYFSIALRAKINSDALALSTPELISKMGELVSQMEDFKNAAAIMENAGEGK